MLSITTRYFLFAFATFGALHILLVRLYLYWRYEWLDIPMHFFGGALIALGLFAARDMRLPFAAVATRPAVLLASVVAIAIAWEIFEFTAGISRMREGFWDDTVTDLILGIIGGAVGMAVGRTLTQLEATE